MSLDPLQLRRLQAHHTGRAVATHTRARQAIQSHAMIFTMVKFPGDDASILAGHLGPLEGTSAHTVVIPDQTDWSLQEPAFAVLAAGMRTYFDHCRRNGLFPQLLVTDHQVVHHLENLVTDYCWGREATAKREFAQQLSFFTSRSTIAGQQSVVALRSLLQIHWVTALHPSLETHLGALLMGMQTTERLDPEDIAAYVRCTPMSTTTSIEDDNMILDAAFKGYARHRRSANASGSSADVRKIEALTLGVVGQMFETVKAAVAAFDEVRLPELSAVPLWQARERKAFRKHLENPRGWPSGTRADAITLAARELMAAHAESVTVLEDPFARACAVSAGTALRARLMKRDDEQLRPRKTIHRVSVWSDQESLGIRQGDEVTWVEDPRLRALIERIARCGEGFDLVLRVTSGMGEVDRLVLGRVATFVAKHPDASLLGRSISKLWERTRPMPGTHSAALDGERTANAAVTITDDPILFLESLR